MYQFSIKAFKHIFLAITLWLGVSSNGTAQDHKLIDSLKNALDKVNGIQRFDLLLKLGIESRNISKSESIRYLKNANDLAYHGGDSLKIVHAGWVLGEIFRRFEQNDDAIEILNRTLPIARRNNQQKYLKFILNTLALVHAYKAEYDKALIYNFESLLLRENHGDKVEISIALNNIGFVYFKLRNYDKAVEFYDRSLKLKQEAGDIYDLDRLLINIGLCHNQMGNYEQSRRYFNEAFEVCGDNCSDEIIVEGQFGLGVSSYNQHNLDASLMHFMKSLKVARKANYQRFQGENSVYIGKIYIQKNQTHSAIQALKEAENVAESLGYKELLIDTYRQFSTLFNKMKQFENAAFYQSKYISLKDSTYSERLIDNLAKIQTNYAERENIATIAAKDEIIQRQRSLNLAMLGIALLVSVLLIVLFHSNWVKRKANRALLEAKTIIEEQNRRLLYSNYNLNLELQEKNLALEKTNDLLHRANEELDNFIYKTSHDIRGPLASLKGMCNVAIMDVKDPVGLDYLQKLDVTAEKLNTILTRLLIVNQINNSTLGYVRIDFEEIVDDVLNLERKKGLPDRMTITKHIDNTIEFYSDRAFVRIILENLIDNAIKFYNQSERIEPFVDISITRQLYFVHIKVIDNGIGVGKVNPDKLFQMFSRASERSETGGIGLYITKTATEKLGGSVDLRTTIEGYTEFFVTLPLAPAGMVQGVF